MDGLTDGFVCCLVAGARAASSIVVRNLPSQVHCLLVVVWYCTDFVVVASSVLVNKIK